MKETVTTILKTAESPPIELWPQVATFSWEGEDRKGDAGASPSRISVSLKLSPIYLLSPASPLYFYWIEAGWIAQQL
jgi:hypothetical protein